MSRFCCKKNVSQSFYPWFLWGALILLLIVILLGNGLWAFHKKINTLPLKVAASADGIIVLTGGRKRLETGLILLGNGMGERLLISGVNPVAGRYSLRHALRADPRLFSCCVDLGQEATNTVGNAEESAQWVAKNHYKRVFIVTNMYHMPRSLIELKYKIPNVTFIPYPVELYYKNEYNRSPFGEYWRIIMIEYIKYLSSSIIRFF